MALLRSGDPAGAVVELGRALAIEPGNGWIRARHAGARLSLAFREQSRRTPYAYQRDALDARYLPILHILQDAAARDPEDPWISCQIVESLRCLRRFDECTLECSQLIERAPDLAWAHQRRSRAHRARLRYDDALRDIRRARELRPRDAASIGHEATVLGLMGRTDEAIELFDRARAEQGPGPSYDLERAIVLIHAGRHEQALPWLERSMDRADRDLARYCMVVVTTRLGNHHSASSLMQQTVASAEAMLHGEGRTMGRYLLAGIDTLRGRARRAVDRLAEVMQTDDAFVEFALIDPVVRPLLSSTRDLGDIVELRIPVGHPARQPLGISRLQEIR